MLAPLAPCDPAKGKFAISRLAEMAMIEGARLSGVGPERQKMDVRFHVGDQRVRADPLRST